MLRHLTPPLVAALGLGAVSAAVMSSVDASVLSASSMAAWNVYRPLVEPDASSARLTVVLKRAVIVVGVAATLMALHVRSIYTLWVLCSDLVYCVLFPQLVLALNDRRRTAGAPTRAWLVSFVLRVGLRASRCWACPCSCRSGLDASGAASGPVKTLAMLAGLVTMWAVSRATASRCPPLPLKNASA